MLTLPFQPNTYIKMPAPLRKRALKNWFATAAIISTVNGLAWMNGAETEEDLRSSDFGKIKIGNTRFDVAGGFLQYVTQLARQVSGQRKTQSGKIVEMGSKPTSPNEWDELTRFLRTKASPTAGFIIDAKTGKDVVGQDFQGLVENYEKWKRGEDAKLPNVIKLFMPMILEDGYDLITDPTSSFMKTAVGIPAMLHGVGVQTYPPYKPKKQREN
jgi:hypothetical protein